MYGRRFPYKWNFYPRSPCGERLAFMRMEPGFNDISIHALLAESDYTGERAGFNSTDFYPRSPCGERLIC